MAGRIRLPGAILLLLVALVLVGLGLLIFMVGSGQDMFVRMGAFVFFNHSVTPTGSPGPSSFFGCENLLSGDLLGGNFRLMRCY